MPAYQILRFGADAVKYEEIASLDNVKLGDGPVWINLVARAEKELEGIKKTFNFHQLALEECVGVMQRSKLESYGDYLLVVMKNPDIGVTASTVVINQIAIFIGPNYLVTVCNRKLLEVEALISRMRAETNVKHWTPDFIAYKILDLIVDSYFPILASLEARIEAVEREILEDPTKKPIIRKLSKVKRDLLALRKAMWPSRDVFVSLSKEDLPNISERNRLYFRDVYDHVVVLIDLIESYRDLLSNTFETYLSAVSNSLNEVMKVLTVIATIFMPLTFIAGVYGMNFHYLPEIYWEYGYPMILLLMLIVGGGMLYYFHRKGWV